MAIGEIRNGIGAAVGAGAAYMNAEKAVAVDVVAGSISGFGVVLTQLRQEEDIALWEQ